MKPTMKRNLLALAAAGAIALGGFVVVQAQPGPGGADAHGRSWQPADKAGAPARELPHRHFEAQL